MPITVKEFDEMTNDTLRRITNSTGISNIRPGSVVRTLVEAILAEQDIQYYQISQVFEGMDIEQAKGSDLDRLVKILGVVRKNATSCNAMLTFGRSTELTFDVVIPSGSIVSTYPDNDGNTIEFVVNDDVVLEAGELEVTTLCTAREPGIIYVPMNTVAVMNKPILNIEYVNNAENIYGGSERETDDELRERSKDIFASLGKGTIAAIESAIMAIDGVLDVICVDCSRGVGTADVIVVTATTPPSADVISTIEDVMFNTKAAGIDAKIIYPTIMTIDISVNVSDGVNINVDDIGNAIIDYTTSLGVADTFIINQLERAVLNVCSPHADINTISPSTNVSVGDTSVARCGVITINGVVWNG